MIGGVTIWEIKWTVGLTHLSGLPHLPGVPPSPCKQALLALQRRRNFHVSKRSALESLKNDHDDGNDNGKKAKRFD